jgi:hypothetical protein
MVGYASRTGTVRNLDALRQADWRLMVSATGAWRTEGFRYAIDNGAWTAFQSGKAFDEAAFDGVVAALGHSADFVIVPDIVCGGLGSLRLSESWLPRLDHLPGRLLIAVQNGIEPADVRPILGGRVGIFVGGDTEWKLATLPKWGRLAGEMGVYLHVGRVNTRRRIRLCAMAGAHSFDGTSATVYSATLPMLDRARRSVIFFGAPAT